MPVYSYRSLEDIRQSLKNMAANVFQRMTLTLSEEDFRLGFVHPDHIGVLEETAKICGIKMYTNPHTTLFTSAGDKVNCQIVYSSAAPMLVPDYVSHGLTASCPTPLKNRITAWLDDRVKFGRAFGDVHDSLQFLNDNSGDLKAMSVMLPCLPSIIRNISEDQDSKAAKRARTLLATTKYGKLPRISADAKKRLIDASALVNAATLMLESPIPTNDKLSDGQLSALSLHSDTKSSDVFHTEGPGSFF